MTTELRLTADLDITAAAGEGKLPRFSMIANTGGVMRLEGWRYPVVLDLAGLAIPSQSRPVRMNHDSGQGIGHTDSIRLAGGELNATGVISRDTAAAKDVVASGRNGFPWQASVGASVEEHEFIPAGKTATVNGKTFPGPVNVVHKSTLGEISFVDLGADPNTSVVIAKKGKHMNTDANIEVDPFEQETRRVADIEAAFVQALTFRGIDHGKVEEIRDRAIAAGTSANQAKAEMVRSTYARAVPPGKADLPTRKVLECGLLMHLGVSDEKLSKDLDYGPDVVTQAYPTRHRGLRSIIAQALEASGVHAPHNGQELYTAVLENQHRIRAEGFSTINLPGILGNIANKYLLEAFIMTEVSYPLIAEQADFANFQLHSLFRLDHLGDFQIVGNDGDIKHGRLSQSAYTNQLSTYGQIISMTRQNVINDDLNAFKTIATTLARKARLAVEKATIDAVMESTPSFYTTARGNLLTGSLSVTALGAAEAAMASMTDVNGDPIFAVPKLLLVPPPLRALAEQLFISELLQGATASAAGQPAQNPFRGRFTVVTSPYMTAPTLDGNSPTTWYLLANPLYLPAFQVAYLNGMRQPTVQTADSEFDTLGFQLRVYFDYGVAQVDYRGIIKSQ
jgi:hypothetical protein